MLVSLFHLPGRDQERFFDWVNARPLAPDYEGEVRVWEKAFNQLGLVSR
jgi:hypothetical protein